MSSHTSCSGRKTPGRSAAFQRTAGETVKDKPEILGVGIKRKLRHDSGLKVNHQTASRMKNNAKKATRAALTGSYQQLGSLCDNLRTDCP